MKKYNALSAIYIAILLIPMFSTTGFANSSWHWLTDARPIYILPIVIVITLFLEIYSISFVCNEKPKNIACAVTLANIASFAAPYLFELIFGLINPYQIYSFFEMIDHTPMFTIGTVYLVMTITIELPVVYFCLHKNIKNKKRLLITTIGINTLTTIMVAVVERIVCLGHW